jgi:hypothetical protein
LQAVKEEWKTLLKEEFSSVEPFLTPCPDLATSFPRRGQSRMGLPLRVVQHGDEDFVAVCDATGQRFPILRADLIVYRFDHARFFSIVCGTLNLTPVRASFNSLSGLTMIGSPPTSTSEAMLVFVAFPTSTTSLERAMFSLLATFSQPVTVITPTQRLWSDRLVTSLRNRKSNLFAFEKLLTATPSGGFAATPEAVNWLQTIAADSALDAVLDQTSMDVLTAMLEMQAVSPDSRKIADKIAAASTGGDANSLKAVMAHLTKQGFVRSQTGRGGGSWLSEKGQKRARSIKGSQ